MGGRVSEMADELKPTLAWGVFEIFTYVETSALKKHLKLI